MPYHRGARPKDVVCRVLSSSCSIPSASAAQRMRGEYGDAGADTLGHIAEACAEGRGDRDGLRERPLAPSPPVGPRPRPRLRGVDRSVAAGARASGLARKAPGVTASKPRKARTRPPVIGRSQACRSISTGAIFPIPSRLFPEPDRGADRALRDLPGILGNKHASGTDIIDEFGAEHVRSGIADLLHVRRQRAADRRP